MIVNLLMSSFGLGLGLGSPGQSQETRRQPGMFRLVRYLISRETLFVALHVLTL